MAYKIEKNVPLKRADGKSGGMSSAMRRMEIGDSFVAVGKHKRQQAYSTARRVGIQIQTSEIETDTFRIWRVKSEAA